MRTEAAYLFSPQWSAAGDARACARTWATGVHDESLQALELVVSELVTNALQHGAGDITLTMRESSAGLEVEVHDNGPRVPTARKASRGRIGGRGLGIVQAVSTAWGVRDASDEGKTVWAVIKSSAPEPDREGRPSRDERS